MKSSLYIDEYTHFLSDVRRKSRNTVESYRRDITQYITYITENFGIDAASATHNNVMSYLEMLTESGKAASTVSRAVASLKSFYFFLSKNGSTTSNPAASLEAPKPEKKLPHILTAQEIESLLSAPSLGDNKSIRDKAMLELLYATGIRVSELIGLNMSDINLSIGFIRCRSARKERIIPLGRTAAEAAENYIENVRPHMIRNSSENSLFVNINGSRLTRQGFWKIIKHYGEAAGIQSELTPHTLRHSFAAHLVRNGADLESIKEMMGHADISSTQVYSMLPDEHLMDVYDKSHPRA